MYNASKAALMSWSETLRLELEPFGVRVISLVTGSVATNVMSHAELELPRASLYQKAIQEIRKRGVGEDVQSKSSPTAFAKVVVADILGGATSPLWRGAMASMVRLMSSFAPTSMLVSSLERIAPSVLIIVLFIGPCNERGNRTRPFTLGVSSSSRLPRNCYILLHIAYIVRPETGVTTCHSSTVPRTLDYYKNSPVAITLYHNLLYYIYYMTHVSYLLSMKYE